MQLNRGRGFANSDIEDFDEYGEGHREVDVTFRNVLPKALSDQCDADEEKEAEGQHFHRRVTVHKPADRSGEEHHEDHSHDDGPNHDGDVVDHADGGYDRVEREDNIQKNDLDDYGAKGNRRAREAVSLLALETLMDFMGAFPDKENSSNKEDEIATTHIVLKQRKQGLGEPGHPDDRQKEKYPCGHG